VIDQQFVQFACLLGLRERLRIGAAAEGAANAQEDRKPSCHFEEDAPARLLAKLPTSAQRATTWLRRPRARWLRIPIAVLLILGGWVGFLPILGFWMVPLGALLLPEDIPILRQSMLQGLGAVQRWWDRRRPRG